MHGHRAICVLATFTAAALLFSFQPAGATCLIAGSVSAAPNPDPSCLGAWEYTLSVTWDTGSPCGLSHLDLLLAHQGEGCDCPGLDRSLNWLCPIGTSTGVPAGCTVAYEGLLNCNGDPSVDVTDLLLKFEPIESEECEPGPTGQAIFTLYSNYAPAPITEPNLFLVDKFGQLVCSGQLTGVFPGLPCDPTAAETDSWGHQKTTYR